MSLHIEFLTADKIGILRGGPDFKKFGDKFSFSAVAIIEGETLHIKNMTGTMSLSIRNDIKELMRTHGYKKIVWERVKKGKMITNAKWGPNNGIE